MAVLQENRFNSYNLTEEEFLAATRLTDLQRMKIQTELSQIAHRLLNWTLDLENYHVSIATHAELQGRLNAYSGILDDHADSVAKEIEAARESNQYPTQ
jgi:hypothetical protein